MGTAALESQATVLARQDAGAGAFSDVGEVINVNSPGRSRAEIDTSALGETLDSYLLSSLERRDPMSFTVQVDPDGVSYQGLSDSFQANQVDGWRITWPDSSTLIFSGGIQAMGGIGADIDGKLTEDITVRPTGAYAEA